MTRRAPRLLLGFLFGLVLWAALSRPYEPLLAGGAGLLLSAFESPDVTRLAAEGGGIRVERRDFPPRSPRPVLPAADLHFNFVLLVALFALGPALPPAARLGRFLIALSLLFLIHAAALLFQVESVYATALGPWSEAHYGAVARNFWAGGFHFYQIAGRFAAPFVLWWALGRGEAEAESAASAPGPPRRQQKKKRKRS